MAIPTKGLNQLRTLSGRVDQLSLPYRSYMQITCLEMERARRNMERKSASHRVALIDTRIEEIERSKQDLLDRKSTRLNSSHLGISYAVFCLQWPPPAVVSRHAAPASN